MTEHVAEVEHRASTLQDVNVKQRLIDLIIVPYDQEADVFWRGDIWHESHDRQRLQGPRGPCRPCAGQP